MTGDRNWPNLAAMMFDRAQAWPDRPMLRAFRDGAWRGVTWGEFARMTASAARALRRAGVQPGDRVVIVSENRPDYPVAETALLAIRAVPVPTYTTNTVEDHAHILRDSGAKAAIVSTTALAARVARAAGEVGGIDLLVTMDGDPATASPEGVRESLTWEPMISDTAPPDDIAREAEDIPSETLACLIYTSGTGGAPKGVMLPHRSILSNCHGAYGLLASLNLKDEVYLSFLPISHAFEHTAGQFFLLSVGTEIVYARSVETLAPDMLSARPTIMTVVPRILEVIRARILGQMSREPEWRRRLFDLALAVGLRRLDGTMTLADRLLDPVLDRLVRAKVRARFGGRLRAVMSGGARLEPEVGRFFLAMGLMIMQGYGQTEAGPVISANPAHAIRIDTVGQLLHGVEARIDADGEILVRGGLVMDGYWGNSAETATVVRDGWLHTGDIGAFDTDGYLRITDRKRDIIVLAGGDNVSPARIETMLMAEAPILQAVVTGDGRAGLLALVVPTEGVDETAVAAAVSEVNMRLSVRERIRRHQIVPPFTLTNGLLTPTQKIKRRQVIREYAGPV